MDEYLLKLKGKISETIEGMEVDDILNTKKQLKKLGYYQEPKWGITHVADNAMFEGISKFQKDNGLKVDRIMKPGGETETAINNLLKKKQSNVVSQISGALSDLYRNYQDMKIDNTIGNDDYFHCKANYDETQRGKWGEKTAKYIGDAKERFDYLKNRIRGIPPFDAYVDYLHDKDINAQGRQQAKNSLYETSKTGCLYKRVRGINDKY